MSSLELADLTFSALAAGDVMGRHFPMLLSSGIPDVAVTVHSHFLTLLSTVGQSLSLCAVSECPLWWAKGELATGDVRADSVWFSADGSTPEAVVEFERFEPGDESKLRNKVENLAISSLGTPALKLAILVYWLRSGSAPNSMESIVAHYRDGFRRRGEQVPPGRAPLMIVKCVMRPLPGTDRLVFGEFLRDTLNERRALGRT